MDENSTGEAKPSRRLRSGGRAANTARRGDVLFKQSPWRLPVNMDRPTEPLSEEGVLAIHNGAMHILEEIGIEFLNEEAQQLFKNAGCKVDGTNVKMGRDWVMDMVAKVPSQFTITPRNPDHEIIVGGNHAQGVARAAASRGIKATIVMPEDAPTIKVDGTRAFGAEIVFYDRYSQSREEIGEAITQKYNAELVRPYEDVRIIAGQGTVGHEIAAQCAAMKIIPDALLCCCGGGGLIAGTS
ncbi:pyridoxal-phosphate dependent enzyme, partial [Alphaproteobacteria bacterium]|nr:pyridoxal-phosphate dependent enzyme [Alphaproteobacteria bacterium]